NYLSGAGTHPTTSDTLYFSLITLTTVGYGDIVPVANVARAVASIEALIGQLYLVSVVAAVVSRFVPASRRAAASGGTGGNTADSAGGAPAGATDEAPRDSPGNAGGGGDGGDNP
ncbi:MAG TPA: potassium channel family protein, partial [Micromonosporaceae bacterium]